ncbi:hypothetical protein C2845_PMPSC004474 [Panicum miliaceum]|uniref:AAA+ ATPase domain-containing protein n=1 Tax=Panicum miliaceum TaxID=4540 RepID=A0A3L6P9F1_PANMI|nr:hypothetical protein C2845_PMPSC004474 [Panicum miliaceum]
MATVAMDVSQPSALPAAGSKAAAAKGSGVGEGLGRYYKQHIHDVDLALLLKINDLRRQEAQRNVLNSRVKFCREELNLLQEPASHVGEVVKVMSKSKVLVKVEKVPDSTYDMIGGLDQQIKEIKEVIELPIKHPELFSLGIANQSYYSVADTNINVYPFIFQGILYGPPGTGKTLLARAVAHHTDCTFIRVSGSELVQKYIGEGSRMVRELFVMAREHAPSIIFMDEIDSIGSARMGSGGGGGDSEVQRTMLELLNQLDGFESTNKIKVLMATNRMDILDQALLRPGRIDRKIEFPNPSETIAAKMNGSSGAELKAVCTEAGMFALRERRVHVTQEDFEMAVSKVMKKDIEKNMSLWKLWK